MPHPQLAQSDASAQQRSPLQPGPHQLGAQQRSLGRGLFAMDHQPGQLKLQPPKTPPNTLQLHPSAGRPLHLRDCKLPRPLVEFGAVQVPRHAHRSEQQHQRQRAQPRAQSTRTTAPRHCASRLPGRGFRCPSLRSAPARIFPALALRSSSSQLLAALYRTPSHNICTRLCALKFSSHFSISLIHLLLHQQFANLRRHRLQRLGSLPARHHLRNQRIACSTPPLPRVRPAPAAAPGIP